jgi:hypothetical protein
MMDGRWIFTSLRLPGLVLLAALGWPIVPAWPPALAQTGSPSAAGSLFRIAGTVVNAVTGEPVRDATVAVLGEQDSRRIASAQTGSDGRFSIEGLGADKFQLSASKRGLVTAFYEEHGDFSSAVVTGEGQDTSSLMFRLVPGAVLRGVVSGDGGDPVEGAQVMLYKKPRGHGPGEKIVQADTATTDDTGAYEFGNLAAGEYLLAVKAHPWYAMSRSPARARQGAGGEARAALDVAYPITYFDSTTDEASASPIELAGGSRVEADVSLHAVPALHLEVPAPLKQNGGIARPELRQSVFGAVVSDDSAGFMDALRTGTTEFAGLAPGSYELTEGDPPRVVELEATSSQQVEANAGIPAVPLAGTLQNANGSPLEGQAVVTLEPVGSAMGLKPMESGFNRGAFSFTAVAAGAWKLEVEVNGLPAQVLQIASGGHAHAGNMVTVEDRALTLAVRVSAGGTRVEGFAQKDGKGAMGAMVLLIPKGAGFPDLVRLDQSDSDGSFSLLDAAPGEYTVVAIEDGWGMDWTQSQAIGRYLPAGIPVTVPATTMTPRDQVVRLAAPVPLQPR